MHELLQIWSEVWDGEAWQVLEGHNLNFRGRLDEGIGAWTGVTEACGLLPSGS